MKKIIFSIAATFITLGAMAQNNLIKPKEEIKDRMPQFGYDRSDLNNYLSNNLIYPLSCLETPDGVSPVHGTVTVKFLVEPDGCVSNASILQSPHPALGKEALRVIGNMPPFKPALKDGEPIAAWQKISINFASNAKTAPIFQGGEDALKEEIKNNLKFPKAAREVGRRDTVMVYFFVDEKGEVKFQEKSLIENYTEIENATLKAVKKLPDFIPGKRGEIPVITVYAMTVDFYQPDDKTVDMNITLNKKFPPMFPGGEAGLMNAIKHSIRYPEEELAWGIEGTVLLRFTVTEDGRTENIKIVKGANPAFDKEAVEVIKKLPRFNPAMEFDNVTRTWKPVKNTFHAPIHFYMW